jgi:hypothetical protein
MLGWAILMLACIGYFLNEALRAPVIETDEADAEQDRRNDPPDPPEPTEQTASQYRPVGRAMDQ